MRICRFAFYIVLLCLLTQSSFGERGGIHTNSVVQSHIGRLAVDGMRMRTDAERQDFQEDLSKLEAMLSGDRVELLKQIIVFLMSEHEEDQWLGAIGMFNHLGFSNPEKFSSVLPFVEHPPARRTQEVIYGMLSSIDSPNGGEPNFSWYENAIRKRKNDVPLGLIGYIYHKDPDSALSSLANVYLKKDEVKALMDKTKNKDEAKALDLLSKRSEWWVHLYVAEKMRKNPKLRSYIVIKRLKKSKHPLVQEAIKDIEKQNKLK